MTFPPAWPDPPGYRAACAAMAGPRYGWAVLTANGIAIRTVTDWPQALQAQPCRWLNRHPDQPTTPEATAALAEHTWKNR